MPKRVLCKFFARGSCVKGDYCEFSHDQNNQPTNICTFYQKGCCFYGTRCRYEHVKASWSQISAPSSSSSSRENLVSDSVSLAHPSRTALGGVTPVRTINIEFPASSIASIPPTKPGQKLGPHDLLKNGDIGESRSPNLADHAICSFAAAGSCQHGEKCPHFHGDLCAFCGKHCLHPFRPEEREEHIKSCEKRQRHLEAVKCSQEIECSVCLERVLSKPTAAERKFGLLSECDHPFCLSCIRNWRSTSPATGMNVNSALKACPVCRKRAYFVIPSVIWYSTKEEKQEIIDSYKAKLRSIDCKHFDFGNGTCPFGTRCFYKHTVKAGSYRWKATVMPETFSSVRVHSDDTDDSSDDVDMDDFLVLSDLLYGPHGPLGVEEYDDFTALDEQYDDFTVLDEEYDDFTAMDEAEVHLVHEMMALLQMQQQDIGWSDSSSSEDFCDSSC